MNGRMICIDDGRDSPLVDLARTKGVRRGRWEWIEDAEAIQAADKDENSTLDSGSLRGGGMQRTCVVARLQRTFPRGYRVDVMHYAPNVDASRARFETFQATARAKAKAEGRRFTAKRTFVPPTGYWMVDPSWEQPTKVKDEAEARSLAQRKAEFFDAAWGE